MARLYPFVSPVNVRTEREGCAARRRAHFEWLAQNPAAYQNFLNRSLRS